MVLPEKNRISAQRATRRSQGLTLIEVVITIAIMGLIATVVYGGFAQSQLNRTRIGEMLDFEQSVNITLQRMARELSSAYVTTQLNPDLSNLIVRTAFVGTDGGSFDRLDFTSFSHVRMRTDAHESDQNELSYYVANDPEDATRKVLVRREAALIDDKPQEGGGTQILLSNVRRLEIEYFDPTTTEWLKRWDTTQQIGQPNRLPAQVKVILEVARRAEQESGDLFSIRVPIPITYALNFSI